MVRLGWVAGSGTDALILDVEALSWGEVLIRRISPELFTHLDMEVLRECLSKSISEGFDHNVVVIITLL